MNKYAAYFALILLFSFPFLFSVLTYAQSVQSNCVITKVGNPQGEPSLPPFCESFIGGSAPDLARQILANPRIKLLNSSRKDIEAVRDGKRIQNSDSCGTSVTIHPELMRVMLELGKNHTYDVWNIITEHGCDQWNHPRGRAMDIGQADGKGSWQNREFRQHAADVLPAGGGLLQTYCPGTPQVVPKRKLIQGADGCHHQHIDVGTDIK